MSQILLCALTSALLHANPNAKAVREIERANRKLRAAPTAECVDCKATQAGREESHRLECLREICPRGFGQLEREMKKAGEAMDAPPDQEFLNALRDSIRALLSACLEDVRSLRRAIASDAPLKDQSARRMVRYSEIQRKISDRKGRALSRADMAGIAAFNAMEDKVSATSLLEEEFDFLAGEFTPEAITAIARQAREQIKAARDRIAARTHVAAELPSDARIDEAINGGQVTPALYNRLRRDLRNTQLTDLLLASDAFDAGGKSSSLKRIFGAEDAKLARVEKLLQRYVAHEPDTPLGKDEIGRLIEKNVDRCLAAHVTNTHFAPNEEQIEVFWREVPRIASQYVQSLKAHLSRESSAALEAAAHRWVPALPQSAATLRTRFLQDIRALKSDTERESAYRKASTIQNPEYSLAQQTTFVGNLVEGLASTLDELCARNEVEPVRDAAYVGEDRFKVGPMSVTHPDFGNSVLRHEFGHLASGYFRRENAGPGAPVLSAPSKRWFTSVRKCLSDVPGHGARVEEDWADYGMDLIASTPSACYVIGTDRAGFSVQDAKDADHSPELFRLLQHRYRQGLVVPESCNLALKHRGESFAGACRAEPGRTETAVAR